MSKIILAPHLDDEIIGCFSVMNEVDKVVYYTYDYRESQINKFPIEWQDKYVRGDAFDLSALGSGDIVYVPSRFDLHPFHKVVRHKILDNHKVTKMFYSIDMNVPWLEEEQEPRRKLDVLKQMFPGEDLFEKNAKYWLFKSIKEYDEIIWYTVSKSTPTPGFKPHLSTMNIYIQLFHIDEKVEGPTPSNIIPTNLLETHRNLTIQYQNRKIKIEFNGITVE